MEDGNFSLFPINIDVDIRGGSSISHFILSLKIVLRKTVKRSSVALVVEIIQFQLAVVDASVDSRTAATNLQDPVNAAPKSE
jgi:hypothetical protein